VSQAEKIIPAVDLSEQISTAGMEASGTGNMKMALNGALTIGTLDGANVEIMEAVGRENIFIFGLTAEQVTDLRTGGYNHRQYYHKDEELLKIINMIASGYFNPDEPNLFEPVIRGLLDQGDYYMLLADYRPYVEAQEKVGLKMNLRQEDLPKISAILPAMRKPTLSYLSQKGWLALETVIDEKTVRALIPQLKKAGAEGIIEYSLNKVIH